VSADPGGGAAVAEGVPGLRANAADSLLRVEEIVKEFPVGGGIRGGAQVIRAVDGVSFDVDRGETFGLVGETGCGKSTLGRCIIRLQEPTSGRVYFDGMDVLALDRDELRRMRRRFQIVFQDPYSSLDPRMSVAAIVEEGLRIHDVGSRADQREQALELLSIVGLNAEQATRKPHAFSGGQRQRIALARALVLNPELVVLDEPISALDVSIQAQVMNLLRNLQERFSLTYVFIVHDLAVAEYFCDRLAVLYLGGVQELADREAIFNEPLHPYTVSLLSAVPIPDPARERRRERIVLRGEVSPTQAVLGCRFRPRCPVGRDREVCMAERPPLRELRPGHWVACHFPGELPVALVMGEQAARAAG
jgi:oligopeptide/dipeptide ABC transporter ATP-binding protein